jgi:hypothetical protein
VKRKRDISIRQIFLPGRLEIPHETLKISIGRKTFDMPGRSELGPDCILLLFFGKYQGFKIVVISIFKK